EYRNRGRIDTQGTEVSGTVDTARQATGYSYLACCKTTGKFLCDTPACRCRPARADDGNLDCVDNRSITPDKQGNRWIRDLFQQCGIAWISITDKMITGTFEPGQILLDQFPVSMTDLCQHGRSYTPCGQVAPVCIENICGTTVIRKQLL